MLILFMLIIEHGKAFVRRHYGAGELGAGGLLHLPKWWGFRRGSLIVPKRYASREVKLVGEIDVEHGGEGDDERGFDRAIERASGMGGGRKGDGGWIYRKWGLREIGQTSRDQFAPDSDLDSTRPTHGYTRTGTVVREYHCGVHTSTRESLDLLFSMPMHGLPLSLPPSLVCPRLSPLPSPLPPWSRVNVGTLVPRDIRHRKSRCVARWAGHPKSFTPIWTGGTIYSRHDNWPIKTGRERSSYLPSDNYTVSSRRFDHVSTRPGVGGGDEWRWEREGERRRKGESVRGWELDRCTDAWEERFLRRAERRRMESTIPITWLRILRCGPPGFSSLIRSFPPLPLPVS